MARWRGRPNGLAIVASLAGAALLALGGAWLGGVDAGGDGAGGSWHLVLRDGEGETVLRVPLPGHTFALRYRNSVYRSAAEERFAITADGRIGLVGLSADEAAVLEEYYAVAGRPERAPNGTTPAWRARPLDDVVVGELSLAATEHGRRTLIVDGSLPIELWPLVDEGEPTLSMRAEPPAQWRRAP